MTRTRNLVKGGGAEQTSLRVATGITPPAWPGILSVALFTKGSHGPAKFGWGKRWRQRSV